MSRISEQDFDGCVYTMNVLREQEGIMYGNEPMQIINCTHTEDEKAKYDMDWTGVIKGNIAVRCMDENKDRRWGWKTIIVNGKKEKVRDYSNPQYLSKYSSQMFNFDKYEPMMEKYNETGIRQYYTSGYLDGVILFDVVTLPKELIYKPIEEGGWKIMAWVDDVTMDGNSEKKLKPRFLIPNEYGHIYRK